MATQIGNIGGIDVASRRASFAVLPALDASQAGNLARFEQKLPAGAQDTAIYALPGGGRAFVADVPGRVPGSKAIYEKQVNLHGETMQYTKTTIAPDGNIVHVKDKIHGTEVKP